MNSETLSTQPPRGPRHWLDMPRADVESWLGQRGDAPYRARQIAHGIFQRRCLDFEGISDLPQVLRSALACNFCILSSREVRRQSANDGTEKLLLELRDGGQVECVLLRDGGRRTICVSTQVGCAMGCVFCASGLEGVERNLTQGEILEQMLRLQRLLSPTERLSHIVVMGMGEPLANLDRLLPALEVARGADGLGISSRRITISTVGLPAAMDRLAGGATHYHLAVSLHAPNDELRNQLVPSNRRIGLANVLAAADRYFAASGRRLTFEYVLLAGINDQPTHARQLADLLRHRPALLNVIPYNAVQGLPFRTPSSSSVRHFRDILEGQRVTVKFRRRKGEKIDAACGQLRRATAP